MALDLIELPDKPRPPKQVDPKVLVLYSLPKVGKTPCVAQLPDSLILDFEGSTDMITANALTIIGLKPPDGKYTPILLPETEEETIARRARGEYYLSEVLRAAKSKGKKYRFVTTDTITKLDELCEFDATLRYMSMPMGKNFNRFTLEDYNTHIQKYNTNEGAPVPGALKPRNLWESVLHLPKGAGYGYHRESMRIWIDYIQALCQTLIINAHVKVQVVKDKSGKETDAKDLNLTGQIKTMVTALIADATGYMYRKGKQNYISFQPSDEVYCGSRVNHLEGRDILVSEKLEDGTIKTYWENFFTNLNKPVASKEF